MSDYPRISLTNKLYARSEARVATFQVLGEGPINDAEFIRQFERFERLMLLGAAKVRDEWVTPPAPAAVLMVVK